VTDAKTLDPQQLRTWLQGAARRDAVAFRSLYDATSAKLFGFALRILGKRELAEEVLQESFVAIWNNAGSYQSHLAAPMTWMTTIVRNKAFDLLRRSEATAEIDGDQFDSEVINALHDPASTPIEALEMSRDAKALAYCMSALEGLAAAGARPGVFPRPVAQRGGARRWRCRSAPSRPGYAAASTN
jgi:RNA polymerase sigma factor (sigma-70 family)